MNGYLIIGREASVPVVPFTGPWMFHVYFTLLPMWCQLMQICIFTQEQSCLCSPRASLRLLKACVLLFEEVMTVMMGGISSQQGGGTFHLGL